MTDNTLPYSSVFFLNQILLTLLLLPRPYSNGDGRTGAFLSLCLSIDRLETDDNVDIFNTVRWLRSQRAGLVSSLVGTQRFTKELNLSFKIWSLFLSK